MEKHGFHRWAWLVVLALGGLLMLYGGMQDVLLFFAVEAPVLAWHSTMPLTGLICGLIVLASAGLNIIWGWQLRSAENIRERKLALRVTFISATGMVADWISGYYGFGSLMALLAAIRLLRK
ncbi:hypothetical protein K8S19_13205 [bacterium]|nr:hypothetical protein [bacterium]